MRKSNNDVEYSVKEIIARIEDKQEKYHQEYVDKLEALIVQTTKTNGRVNTIEASQANNVNAFNREKDAFANRLSCVENDSKLLTWKVAGLCATVGILSTILTMILGKII